jgi:hypothetical protein
MNVSGLQLPTSLRTRTASMKLRSSTGGGAHCEEDSSNSSSSSLSITKEISFNDQSLVNARHGCPSSPDPLSQASHYQWSGGTVNTSAVDVDAAAATVFKGTTTLLSHQQSCPTPATYSKRRRHSTVSVNSSSHHHSSHAKSPLKLNRREQKVIIISYSILPMIIKLQYLTYHHQLPIIISYSILPIIISYSI